MITTIAIPFFLLGCCASLGWRVRQHTQRLNAHRTAMQQLNEAMGGLQALIGRVEERSVQRAERLSLLADRVGFLENPRSVRTVQTERLEQDASKSRTLRLLKDEEPKT